MREFQRFLPTGWKERPTTVLDVLRAGRAVLEDEQNWIKEHFFYNDNPLLDPDDAYCNHWHVCALGAIGIVTIGNYREVPPSDQTFDGPYGIPTQYRWGFDETAYEDVADRELYDSAARLLRDAIPIGAVMLPECGDPACEACKLAEVDFSDGVGGIISFNDHDVTIHAQVMAMFDKAIEMEQRLANVGLTES